MAGAACGFECGKWCENPKAKEPLCAESSYASKARIGFPNPCVLFDHNCFEPESELFILRV